MGVNDRDWMKETSGAHKYGRIKEPNHQNKKTRVWILIALSFAIFLAGFFNKNSNVLRAKPAFRDSYEKVSLNTASKLELMLIPGIGDTLAERIIERRPFKSVDDLAEISGISANGAIEYRSYFKVE